MGKENSSENVIDDFEETLNLYSGSIQLEEVSQGSPSQSSEPSSVPEKNKTPLSVGLSSESDVLRKQYPEDSYVWKDGKLRRNKDGSPRKRKKRKGFSATYNDENAETSISGQIISGALLITMIDFILPAVVCILNNRFSKGIKVRPDEIRLKQNQKNELEPVANEVTKYLKIKGNPVAVGLAALIGCYGVNFALVMTNKQAEESKK